LKDIKEFILNKSAVALPLQIKESIRDRILSGRLKPDDKLPSENNLAEECGVSRMTARQALIELGHKKILHLAGPKGDSSAEGRFAGYKEALKKYRIEFQPELVRFTEWHSEEGYYETKKFFLNGADKEKVTAIFAGNDEVATGAFKALSELKLKVPEEIALAGYGNLEIGQLLEIPLTTVNQSPVEMGKVASQLLLDKLSGKRNFEERKEVKVPTRSVIRQSCGIQGKNNAVIAKADKIGSEKFTKKIVVSLSNGYRYSYS